MGKKAAKGYSSLLIGRLATGDDDFTQQPRIDFHEKKKNNLFGNSVDESESSTFTLSSKDSKLKFVRFPQSEDTGGRYTEKGFLFGKNNNLCLAGVSFSTEKMHSPCNWTETREWDRFAFNWLSNQFHCELHIFVALF